MKKGCASLVEKKATLTRVRGSEFSAFQVALGVKRNRPVTVDRRKRAAWSPPGLRNDEPYFFISSFFVASPFSILTSVM